VEHVPKFISSLRYKGGHRELRSGDRFADGGVKVKEGRSKLNT
jgi:hypothetical protein